MQASRKWNAHWIRPEEDKPEKNTYYLFRKDFAVTDRAESYTLYITADTRYRVYINGCVIGYGPPLCVSHYHYYDEHQIKLRQGVNCIAVEVYHLGVAPDSVCGLLCEIASETGRSLVSSDAEWKVTRSEAWRQDTHYFRMSMYAPFQEHFDARRIPDGWMTPGFSDQSWAGSRIIKGQWEDRPPAVLPWGHLVPRDIPFMLETPRLARSVMRVEESIDLLNRMRSEDLSISLSVPGQPLHHATVEKPDQLLRTTGHTVVQCSTDHLDRSFDGVYYPSIVLDFGKSINAFLELEISGEAGGMIDIGYAERLINGHFNNTIEGMYADRYVMREGRQRFRPSTWKSFRYVKIMFRSCVAPVLVHRVQASVTEYPYEDRGEFHSNDSTLNQVFEICRYTLRLCSNDSIMDTPWREQAQFVGDVAAVTLGGIYSCFGDIKLPAKFLKQSAANQLPVGLLPSVTNSANNPMVHPDYSLWWVHALWNHYLYTGEAEWIHRYYPHTLKILQYYMAYIGEHQLLENIPHMTFIDWANVDRRGVCAPHNAIFYGVSACIEKMAVLKGDAHTQAQLQQIRGGIKKNFSRMFFSEERGCYADAWVDGSLSPITSEQTNMAAIYWELCDHMEPSHVADRILGSDPLRHTEAQPFFTMITLRALNKIGRGAQALELIRSRWGRRMVDKGATSTFEEWGLNGSWRTGVFSNVMRTQSHAWSAFPAEFLIRSVAGFEIVEPGCSTVRIAPMESSFNYNIAIPIPQGRVSIKRENGTTQVSAPDNVTIQ
ncbi:family 78 glycoside hydrolase catalytic domain [Paenibacillus sp. IB182496]|uniref:Family 78 glycoside hydrolase catalytic domain n=1 Tax=Paenibacillus sabuli TaxID=2772509 RepID=A0A927BZD7_9BACL|nr:family 78 glycoside hydrolase catalytic domain [Paenibacillus sabuli]MBD2848093.1 family 78 glycoside hydrolase catalytic domain [Paenibacillus sabuli]